MQSKFVKSMALLAIVAILAGCGAQATPTVPAEPTMSQQEVVGAAVETLSAQMTQDAIDHPSPTPVPTDTPVPTNTPVPPTNTPAVTNTPAPTNTPVKPTLPPKTWTPTSTATVANSSCMITAMEPPYDNNVFTPGAEFDARWTVKNTSGSTWAAADSDLKYSSGQKMHGRETYDIPADVKNGESVTVVADMIAPGAEGAYYATFAIVSGGKTVCSLPVSISVKNQ